MTLNLDVIRQRLMQARAELLARPDARIELARGDEADFAVMAENKERELWRENDTQERLTQIEKALARLDNGTYGKCLNCGKPIPAERLDALPLTLYDVDCQSKLEKRTRH
jgi:DnaK suppressor protein